MKVLLVVLLWRPSYPFILKHLAQANPCLKLDLALTNDTGKQLAIPESIYSEFNQIRIFNHPSEIFVHCPECSEFQFIHQLLNQFKGTCLWENVLLIYALAKNYDALIFWEDDQIPIWHEGDDFFSSQLSTLGGEEDTAVCVSKRLGYLHKVPPYLNKYISANTLEILEDALGLCNEIVFPGLLTGDEECFVPYGTFSEHGGIEYFAGRKFIYAGSAAIYLKSELPCFFDIPDLEGHDFSRGNDVFFSLACGREVNLKEAENRYFHDPYLFSLHSDNLIHSLKEPVDFFEEKRFFSLINGWLSYGPLLLKLSYPSDWQIRINEVKNILKNLPPCFRSTYNIFCSFADRVHNDFDLYHNTQYSWKMLCEQIKSG